MAAATDTTMNRRHLLRGATAALTAIPAGRAFAQTAPKPPAPPTPAAALPNTPEAYRVLFNTAVAEHKFHTAILVIRRGGRVVASYGHKVDANGPSLIGSMSKPITAVAIATLIRDGRLSFTTPMRTALAGYFKRYGQPADPRFLDVTVEQLLVHRSGMRGNPDGDPVHKARQDRAMRGEGSRDVPQPILAELLKHPLKREPGKEASYSGGGYFALGAVIEQTTGKSYEAFCREAVFGKLGLPNARLHPEWAVLGAAGGWFISGDEYLRFLDVFDPAHPFLGDGVKNWIDQAQTRWDPANSGNWHSLAVATSTRGGRWRVSHGGNLNSHARGPNGQPIHAVIDSSGSRTPGGIGVFFALTAPTVDGKVNPGYPALLRDIERAHAGVKVS